MSGGLLDNEVTHIEIELEKRVPARKLTMLLQYGATQTFRHMLDEIFILAS